MSAIISNASYADCEGTPLIPESQGICDKVECHTCKQARQLLNMGYRKQSEVAKEIFEEIGKLVSTNKKTVGCATYDKTIFYIEDFIEDLTELKKKYIGE